MSNIQILDYKTLDIEKIVYNKPEKIKGGSYMSIPTYLDNSIYIQTPRLLSSKGIVKSDSRCYIDLEFDKSHWPFYEFVSNIDENNMNKIHENSVEWFKKEFPLDIVEDFYKTPIKNGKINTAPSIKIKIPIIKGALSCNIYNSNNTIINYSDIKKDSKIVCVLKFQGLRYLKQQVICEWVPIQIKVFQTGGESTYVINDNLLTDIEDNESMPSIKKTDVNEDLNYEKDLKDIINIIKNEASDNEELENENVEPVQENENVESVQENENVESVQENENVEENVESVESNNEEKESEMIEINNLDIDLKSLENVEIDAEIDIDKINTNYNKIIEEKNKEIENLKSKLNKFKELIN